MIENDPTEPSHRLAPPPLHLTSRTPLSYGYVQQRTNTPRGVIGRIVISFLGYVGVSALWFGISSRFSNGQDWALGGWFFLTLALLGAALYVRIRYKKAGFGYGILAALGLGIVIIIGVLLLIIGICFYNK